MKYLKKYNENIDWNWLDEEEDPNSIPDDFKGNEDFYNFLKDNDALEKWIDNFKVIAPSNSKLKIFLFNKNPIKFIDHGFTWKGTPEGYSYWHVIEDKWIDFKMNKKKYNENIDWDWLDEEEDPNSIPDDFKDHEDFYNFLKDNDALEKWINNLIRWKKNESIKQFLYRYNKKSIIDASFTWDATPEGHSFWSDLNYKWIDSPLSRSTHYPINEKFDIINNNLKHEIKEYLLTKYPSEWWYNNKNIDIIKNDIRKKFILTDDDFYRNDIDKIINYHKNEMIKKGD